MSTHDASAVSLRPATPGDSRHIAVLMDAAGHGYPALMWELSAPEEAPLDYGSRRAERTGVNYSFENATIAEIDGRVAGMLLGYVLPEPSGEDYSDLPAAFQALIALEEMVPGSWYVNAVAVYSEHGRRGVGSALMQDAVRRAQALGCTQLTLIVEEGNVEAIRLYERLGYAVIARREAPALGRLPATTFVLMAAPVASAPG